MNGRIVVENPTKTFKKGIVQAVKDVSFRVEEGEVFAFIGPNGAGKSTRVQILTTLINVSSGKVEVAGYDVIFCLQKLQRIQCDQFYVYQFSISGKE
ncbi:ATP-binding cassette domain-containing protein [Bacillus sp. es.034]|uniref:ATP-binding cassette domain-containing protein n=1 Tax=Bacillus sp. es.034 TaxID=1761763 RepID=UPI000BF29DC3|nr:ATP-binding cassette domain-containing protein [Bacillus sp. es.034]PFG07535.1 ABC-2 type transport system ATP-binding protein [Bacillus sp. es.034]